MMEPRSGILSSATGHDGGGGQVPPSGLPSGTQYRISLGEQTAVMTEVGGALRSYTVEGRPVLDGYEASEVCTGARGQSLIPWPNRIRDGLYSWNGSDQQLDLSEPAKHGAIHGLTRWARPLWGGGRLTRRYRTSPESWAGP